MTSDRDALLASIRSAPGDDAPRLAYADWLREHGDDALANFIRELLLLPPRAAELLDEMVETPGPNAAAYLLGLPAGAPDVGDPRRAVADVIRHIPFDRLPGAALQSVTVESVGVCHWRVVVQYEAPAPRRPPP